MEKKSPPPTNSLPRGDIAAIADQCVKCGQCLEACPTYRLHRHEAYSPRGRLDLMARAAIAPEAREPSVSAAIEGCLSCGRCERACPLHLPIVSAVDDWRRRSPRARSWPALLLRHPRLLAIASRMLRLAPRNMLARLPHGAWWRVLHDRRPWQPRDTSMAAATGTQAQIGILPGCTGRALDGRTLASLATLCARTGHSASVLAPACCGNLDRHAGRVVPKTHPLAAGESGPQTLLHLNTGCESGWQESAPGQDIEDAVTWLARQPDPGFRRHDGAVAVFLPCTAGKAHRDALRILLDRVPGLDWRWLESPLGCCGAAGEQALIHPRQANAMRDAWMRAWQSTGEPLVLAPNIGCSLHIAAAPGFSATILHPLEFLANQLDPHP